jgi:hypothetical protein
MFKVPNEYRIHDGELGSNDDVGNNGAFLIPFESFTLRVIASDGEDWEHVSVSLPNRRGTYVCGLSQVDYSTSPTGTSTHRHPPQSCKTREAGIVQYSGGQAAPPMHNSKGLACPRTLDVPGLAAAAVRKPTIRPRLCHSHVFYQHLGCCSEASSSPPRSKKYVPFGMTWA